MLTGAGRVSRRLGLDHDPVPPLIDQGAEAAARARIAAPGAKTRSGRFSGGLAVSGHPASSRRSGDAGVSVLARSGWPSWPSVQGENSRAG
jgi:hypothetical protein